MSESRGSSSLSFKCEEKPSRSSLDEEEKEEEQAQTPHGSPTSDTLGPSDNQPGAQAATPSTSDIPNGGGLAWLQVVAGFVCFLNSWGLVNAFGVFQSYYSSTLIPNVSNSDISWIGSIQAFLLCSATVFAGPIYDRGHPRLLIIFGTLMVVFGMMMTSLCDSYWQLMLAQGVCVGLGSGCLFLPAIGIIPSYFSTKKAFAMGITASGSSIGGIIYPIIFHRIQPTVGFPWATRVLAFVALALQTIPIACIRARAFATAREKRPLIDLRAFREPRFALFCVASFIGFIGLYIPFFYVSEYAERVVRLDVTVAFYMLPVTSAGSLVGRVLPGLVADRVGPLHVLAACTLVAAVLGFVWMAVRDSLPAMVVWSLLYGAFSGSFVSLQPTTVVALTADLSTVGGRMGLNTFCAACGILIGTPIAGVLVGMGSWKGMQAFCGATLLVATGLVVVTRLVGAKVDVGRKA